MVQRKFFEHLASQWDDRQPENRREILERLLARIDRYLLKSDRVLEVGTGTGELIPILKRRYPQIKLTSIDFASAMIELARKRQPQGGLVQADVHFLPFTDEKFSTVLCHNSFPHFSDKKRALEEIKRVLVQAGFVLILHEQNRDQVNSIHSGALSKEINHDLLPSGDEIQALFLQAGFRTALIEDSEDHYLVGARK